jgi:hypothetical protein
VPLPPNAGTAFRAWRLVRAALALPNNMPVSHLCFAQRQLPNGMLLWRRLDLDAYALTALIASNCLAPLKTAATSAKLHPKE